MFTFENIGFSHTVDNYKYLICADCEMGPVGYHNITTKKCYVALERVKYDDTEEKWTNGGVGFINTGRYVFVWCANLCCFILYLNVTENLFIVWNYMIIWYHRIILNE